MYIKCSNSSDESAYVREFNDFHKQVKNVIENDEFIYLNYIFWVIIPSFFF